MKKNSTISILVLLAVALLIAAGWVRKGRRPETVKRTQVALGTFVEIEVRDQSYENANRSIAAAFQEVQRINGEFSPFNKSGPLWQVNNRETETVRIGRELYDLLAVCDTVYQKTDGAFDPAMEVLFRTWRDRGESGTIPTEKEVETALALSGWQNIILDADLKLTCPPGVEISFGAIAKGYAVDRMTAVLKGHGVRKALINAGGEIRTIGEEWIVGIRHPSIPEELVREIRLSDMAVATSGDYEQYVEQKGKRYHHILNPATGYPARGCSSVTVVAPTCTDADAYATGIFVMGPERGIDLANRIPELEVMIIDEQGSVYYSTGFESYIRRGH